LLGNVSTSTAPTPYPRENPTQYWFSTCSHAFFTELRSVWYVSNLKKHKLVHTKILPTQDYLDSFFTEVSLAHAIMGDGYWENDSQTILICTENFTLEEVRVFIEFLDKRLGLKATTKKRKECYRLRFSSANNNLILLRIMVTPYMHPSMLYKLGI